MARFMIYLLLSANTKTREGRVQDIHYLLSFVTIIQSQYGDFVTLLFVIMNE